MEIASVLACFLPTIFLAAFIGHTGRRTILYLLWGALASLPVIGLAFFISGDLTNPRMAEGTISPLIVTLSPLIEEFFKALPIVIPVILGYRYNNRDILVFAMASGIGFSMVENIWMINQLSFVAILFRSFSTSLMHATTSGIIGYGMVLIRDYHKKALPALLLGFFMVAVVIHAFFNLIYYYLNKAGEISPLFLPLTLSLFVIPFLLFFFLLVCYHVDLPTLFRPDPDPWEFDPPP
nr:PrsW family glutamic-type intramembrane protease [uncultured Methanoregula sp.]